MTRVAAAIVACWDALGDARREFKLTWRASYYALTDPCDLPDPSEGRGALGSDTPGNNQGEQSA